MSAPRPIPASSPSTLSEPLTDRSPTSHAATLPESSLTKLSILSSSSTGAWEKGRQGLGARSPPSDGFKGPGSGRKLSVDAPAFKPAVSALFAVPASDVTGAHAQPYIGPPRSQREGYGFRPISNSSSVSPNILAKPRSGAITPTSINPPMIGFNPPTSQQGILDSAISSLHLNARAGTGKSRLDPEMAYGRSDIRDVESIDSGITGMNVSGKGKAVDHVDESHEEDGTQGGQMVVGQGEQGWVVADSEGLGWPGE